MIQLTDNLRINKNAPVDDRLGVFTTTAEALSSIASDRRYLGLTILIEDAGSAVEYWFENGIQDGDLTVKHIGSQQVNSDWNATSGVAEILNKPTIPSVTNLVPYTGAIQDVDLGTRNLYTNKVYLLDEANDNHGSIHYSDGDFHVEDADGHKLLVIEDGFMQLHLTDTIQSNLYTTNLDQTRDHYLPNQSGTIALTSDITKNAVGLGNVDNTSDVNKPVSTATQTALNAKENTITAGTTSQYYRGDKTFQTLDKTSVGLGNVDNTSDTSKPISTATQTALNAKENTITAGTTSQYYRGDKTFQTLNSTTVGLGNVDNTSDANKPVSTATQTALNNITSLFSNVTQLTTTSTTSATLTSFTVASSSIPVGGVIRIVGLMERTAGTGNTSLGININSAGAKYFQNAGQNTMQFEILIAKMTSTTLRYGLGALATTASSYAGQGSASTSVTQDGSGNFVISVLGLVGTSGATLTLQFIKGNLL
jgi:hypothetical protein